MKYKEVAQAIHRYKKLLALIYRDASSMLDAYELLQRKVDLMKQFGGR